MTTRYQKSQIEDVARLIKDSWPEAVPEDVNEVILFSLANKFADLFAADNPKCCIHCGYVKGATDICDSADGRLRDEHTFEYGFDRDKFLTACGLKKEG